MARRMIIAGALLWGTLALFPPARVFAGEETGRRAAVLYRGGNVAEARALVEKWIADEPGNLDAHLAYVQLRALLGERDKVRSEYATRAAMSPGDRVVRIVQISLLTNAQQKFDAFAKFLEANPDMARGWEEYGRVLLEAYRHREAVTPLEKAVALAPDRSKAHLYLGLAFRARQNPEKEEAELRMAHELDPEDPLTGLELGTTLAFRGESEEAEDLLGGLRDDLPDDPELLSVLALVKFRLGEREESAALRNQVLFHDPDYVERIAYIGEQSRNTAQYDFGERMLNLAVFLDSTFAEAYMQLGILYRIRGRSDDAIRVYEAALRCNEDNQLAWRNLGMSYKDKGDLAKAEEYIRKSVEVDPDYLLGWVDLARLLYKLDDREESAVTWRHVIDMAPYGFEATEARHYLFYLEKGEEVPDIRERGEPWKAPDPTNLKRQADAQGEDGK